MPVPISFSHGDTEARRVTKRNNERPQEPRVLGARLRCFRFAPVTDPEKESSFALAESLVAGHFPLRVSA
jgi:hypothetical protein